MSLFKHINFDVKGDERGSLVSLEENRNVPFEIKRAYYLTKTSVGSSRGFHAHKTLRQLAICVSGSCVMEFDDGKNRERMLMSSFSQGILIEPGIWHVMHDFSDDCVFLVLADDYYDESDYIRDYDAFLNWSRG